MMPGLKITLVFLAIIVVEPAVFSQSALRDLNPEQAIEYRHIVQNLDIVQDCDSLKSVLNEDGLIKTVGQRKWRFDFTPENELELSDKIRKLWKIRCLSTSPDEISRDSVENEFINNYLEVFIRRMKWLNASRKYEDFLSRNNDNSRIGEFSRDDELLEYAGQIIELFLDSEPRAEEKKDNPYWWKRKLGPLGELYASRGYMYFRKKLYNNAINQLARAIYYRNYDLKTRHYLGKAYLEYGNSLKEEGGEFYPEQCMKKCNYRRAYNILTNTAEAFEVLRASYTYDYASDLYLDLSKAADYLGKKEETKKALDRHNELKADELNR